MLPSEHITADVFDKAALRIVYENANFEGSKLFTPSQTDALAQAENDVAKLTARRF